MSKRATALGPLDQLRGEIESLARRREDLREQRAILEAAPRPFTEAEADVARVVEAAAARLDPAWAAMAQRPSGWADVLHGLMPTSDLEAVQPFALLAAVMPDVVTAWAKHGLQESYKALPPPIGTAERVKRLAAIDRELAALERQAAELWWQAADAGVSLPPPEVSPEALLGLEAA
jgi:hypothetical protein